MKTKSKKRFILVIILLAVLGVTTYSLADRYLIRHVEIADVNTVSASGGAGLPADLYVETQEELDVTVITRSGAVPASNGWYYADDRLTISVREESTGSGNSAATFFVADVNLKNASDLENAFAENQFGRNIVAYTSTIAEENNALFAINGDYYGFREDGIIIRNGVLYRDVPARTGLAFYLDGTMRIFDETLTSAQELLTAGVWNTFSFGPALIEDGALVDNSEVTRVDTNIGNHSIAGDQPRTGVGMIDANHFIFIVVDGRSKGYSNGVTLEEFAQLFADLGCTQAYNLDGGGSATMYFMGRVVNNPLGRDKERGTSDILMIK